MQTHTRRAFLGTLGALAAGMVLDPERALWVPGRRTFFDLGPVATSGPQAMVLVFDLLAQEWKFEGWVDVPYVYGRMGEIKLTSWFE